MIYKFVIGTSQVSYRLVAELRRKLYWLEEKKYPLRMIIQTNFEKDIELITFTLQYDEQDQKDQVFHFDEVVNILKYQLAEGLAEFIITEFEDKMIWKEIKKTHKRLVREEKEKIYQKSLDILRNVNQNENLGLLLSYGRKSRIIRKVIEHMEDNTYLYIEGFVHFCMRDYLTEIKQAVEIAQEEIKSEKEYSEFVNLLRYFVESQVPKITEVNLLIAEKGKFFLWDGKGREIKEKLMSYYLDEILLNEVNLDDVLVSILITLSPCRIVIHNVFHTDNAEPITMIRNVFRGRISECTGCEKCLAYQKLCMVSEDQ